jgi:O-antigen ligase
MKFLRAKSDDAGFRTGVLFKKCAARGPGREANAEASAAPGPAMEYLLAYSGLYILTMLMYLRPQEVFPGYFGAIPLIKIVAILTPAIYIVSRIAAGERIMTWTLELKMMLVIWALGLLLMPISASPMDSYNVVFDSFFKSIVIFILLINLLNTRKRVHQMMQLMVFCCVVFSIYAIKSFRSGQFEEKYGNRIAGWGDLFGNPNDFATVMNVILPMALAFALTRTGMKKKFFWAATGLIGIGVLLTFSRGGFLGLILALTIVLWKLGRGRRLQMAVIAVTVSMLLLVAMPGGYRDRILTIFKPSTDSLGSAQERQLLMRRAAELAIKRSLLGVGMGNFHIYSHHDKSAHNSYLEIASELGLGGLLAYLTIIIAPIIALRRIERETARDGPRPDRDSYVLSVCLQASFAAYIICSFFGSIQYLYYLYYCVAFAIALQRIRKAEGATDPAEQSTALARRVHAAKEKVRGVLWKSQQAKRWAG